MSRDKNSQETAWADSYFRLNNPGREMNESCSRSTCPNVKFISRSIKQIPRRAAAQKSTQISSPDRQQTAADRGERTAGASGLNMPAHSFLIKETSDYEMMACVRTDGARIWHLRCIQRVERRRRARTFYTREFIIYIKSINLICTESAALYIHTPSQNRNLIPGKCNTLVKTTSQASAWAVYWCNFLWCALL